MSNESSFEDEDFDDILDHWCQRHPHGYRWEGESGVRNFEQLTKDIGYRQGIEEFLADNPGAIETLLEWISEWSEKGTGWKTKLAEACNYESKEDEDDNYESGVSGWLSYARLLNPNPEQTKILDQIQEECKSNDFLIDDETFDNWQVQSIHQIQTMIKELKDATKTSLQ